MITPSQWIEKLNGIGLTVSAGRYNSGVYAHQDIAFVYANEADVLNMALFGKTAK